MELRSGQQGLEVIPQTITLVPAQHIFLNILHIFTTIQKVQRSINRTTSYLSKTHTLTQAPPMAPRHPEAIEHSLA